MEEFEGVYLIKNHRNSLLFGYKLGFRCLDLNLSSRCFDLKDLKTEEPFRTLEKGLIVYLTKCRLMCAHVRCKTQARNQEGGGVHGVRLHPPQAPAVRI